MTSNQQDQIVSWESIREGGRAVKRDPRREKTSRKWRNKAAERRGNGVMTCYCKYKTVVWFLVVRSMNLSADTVCSVQEVYLNNLRSTISTTQTRKITWRFQCTSPRRVFIKHRCLREYIAFTFIGHWTIYIRWYCSRSVLSELQYIFTTSILERSSRPYGLNSDHVGYTYKKTTQPIKNKWLKLWNTSKVVGTARKAIGQLTSCL